MVKIKVWWVLWREKCFKYLFWLYT